MSIFKPESSTTLDDRLFRVVLAGNPNSGKTTLFNKLTGLRYKVGNYPGVTVEKKAAKLVIEETKVSLSSRYL
jgi:ferrous iron transport protein B